MKSNTKLEKSLSEIGKIVGIKKEEIKLTLKHRKNPILLGIIFIIALIAFGNLNMLLDKRYISVSPLDFEFFNISVPAFKFLWSYHDDINHHYRRYSKLELIKKLKKTGFKIEKISYWNFILFLPLCLIKSLTKAKPKNKNQIFKLNPQINKILENLLKIENKLLKKINMPFGISLFAVARKKVI